MLHPKHLDELLRSAIDPELAALNFHSIDGQEIYDYLCYSEKLERLNAGRLAQKWLDRYAHCESGGWWASGLDPLDSWQPMSWGCFKPNNPKQDYQKPGKFIKYEVPARSETRAFFFQGTLSQSWRIIRRQKGQAYDSWFQRFWEAAQDKLKQTEHRHPGNTEGSYESGFSDGDHESESQSARELYEACERGEYSRADELLQAVWDRPGNNEAESGGINSRRIERLGSLDDGKGFWESVVNDKSVPVTICEGAKKAACLLSVGCTAIALAGVFNGYRNKDAQGNKIDPLLIPDLQAIAQKKRPIYICFDADSKQQTIRNVNIATSQLGRLFQAEGCDVKVINLPGPEKGVDDFIQARGIDAFWQLYKSAMPLFEWQTSLFRQLSYEPNVVVSTKYLGNVGVPDDAKLVVFKAPKGSGKTEAISLLCEEAYNKEQPVIVLTYREQLGRELARRFKLPYKTELREIPEGTLYGFALCVDSCHPKSEARFTGDTWADALVIIDEAESVTWHTLNSATCTKNRLPILHELEALFTRALSSESKGRVVLADADLSDLTIGFVKEVALQPDIKPYVIRSDYKPETGSDVFSYQTPVDLYATFAKAIAEGGKHIIFTGGQRVTSKWGSQNLEKTLSEQFPRSRILRIDKDTVADPNHPAFGCIDNLNAVLPQWDIVIASPVIESGVSIDLHDHFAGIWGFFSGVVPTDNVRQTLARVRDASVKRHLWMPERGLPTSFVGNGATFPTALRNGELKKSKANFSFLLEAGVTVDADGSVQTNAIALSTWLKMASRINAGFHNYRSTILADLRREGHSVAQLGFQLDPEAGKALSELMADSRDELTEDEAQRVVEADPPKSEAEYETLKSQKTKTPKQRRSQLNYEIQQRYAAPPTADIILKDWDGWYPHLRLHYYLTVGNRYLSDHDLKRFGDIAQSGRSWIPDTNRVLLSNKVKALKVLGIDKLFNPGIDWTQDSPEIQEIVKKALACANDVKLFLGVKVTPKSQPMAIVQEILYQALGFRLQQPQKEKPQFIEKGIDSEGKRKRTRIYNFVCPNDRKEFFDRWLLRDAEAAERKIETVSNSEQMDHQTPIDLNTEFNDPSFSDPNPPNKAENPLPSTREVRGWRVGQKVKAWCNLANALRDGVIESVEVNSSNCFKALVRFADDAYAYQLYWDESGLRAA